MVSVIIPCYKNNLTIRCAVMSVLNQTYRDFEVIIIDIARTLDRKLLKTFNEDLPNVKVYSIDERLTAGEARNIGVGLAKGDYVSFLDADDFWREDKLEKQMAALRKYNYKGVKPIMCFTGRALMDELGRYTGRFIGCAKIVTFSKLLKTNQINCSSVVMPTQLALRHPFPESPDGKDMHEDFALWLDILQHGGFAVGINQPLLRYRMVRGSRSYNKLKSALMSYRVYRYTGLGVIHSMYYMIFYTLNGIKKYML